MIATARGPTAGEFRAALHRCFYQAGCRGADQVEVIAGDLHADAGGYSGDGHSMRNCCLSMRSEMRASSDAVVSEPDDGEGESFTIRYKLPRWPLTIFLFSN